MLSSSRLPQTMLSSSKLPQTMLSSSSVSPMRPLPHTMSLPHTMLSSSPERFPQTMVTSSLPQTTLLPQTMLSSVSSVLPHTMLSSSPKSLPQTMLSSSVPSPSPQTMLDPQAGRCSVIKFAPESLRAPHRITCDHVYFLSPMSVVGVIVL